MFDPEGAMALIEAHEVEQTLMVPTMIGMCLAAEGYDPSRLKSLKQLIYGASPMPRQILEKLFTDLPCTVRIYHNEKIMTWSFNPTTNYLIYIFF